MRILIWFALCFACAMNVWGYTVGEAVEVTLRTDDGRMLPLYPLASEHARKKVYAEAIKGAGYTIVIRNRLDRRVGVVVAVDGRNIISGTKSWLRNTERMYLLDPYGVGEFKGWRTGKDKINRFYFTDAGDSYAAAFNDESAMGVIAVAVFPEVRRYLSSRESADMLQASPSAPHKDSARSKAAEGLRAEGESAGTGYGRTEYSPAMQVAFESETRGIETIYIKYEWRSTLCQKGIIDCRPLSPKNRMWNDEGFALPPPGRQ